MSIEHLITARKNAEEAVADMSDGPLKLKAFEMILGSLLSLKSLRSNEESISEGADEVSKGIPTSLADRIESLAVEGFFAEPKSLAEIQAKLAECGWHYPQANLSTPLVRLVRQRRLRRLQLQDGNKRVWKYTLP
jgi:hypothetical protein